MDDRRRFDEPSTYDSRYSEPTTSTSTTYLTEDDVTTATPFTSSPRPEDEASVASYSTVMPWLNISDRYQEMYLLSAYWDNRSADTSPVFISTLVFMRDSNMAKDRLFCFVLCDDDVRAVRVPQDGNRIKMIRAMKEFDGNIYWRTVIPCPTAGCEHPRRVTVGHDREGVRQLTERNSVDVQYPAGDERHEFGICVPPIFGCLNASHVVEWMELQKLLGVSKVVIHNNSQCEQTSAVFRHYADEGLVELRQDHTVLPCDDNKTFGGWHMPMSRVELFVRDPLMLADCLHRHMHDVRHLFFVDMDEILVPTEARTLGEMLDQIERTLGVGADEYYQLTFSNFFFLVDDVVVPRPDDASLPSYVFYLRHRKRLGPSPRNLRPKSLVSGQRCAYVHNHECPAPIHYHKPEAKPPPDKILVPPSIGKVHHYRVNACLKRANNRISCQDGVSSKPVFRDDTLLRYRDELLANVRARYDKLGFHRIESFHSQFNGN